MCDLLQMYQFHCYDTVSSLNQLQLFLKTSDIGVMSGVFVKFGGFEFQGPLPVCFLRTLQIETHKYWANVSFFKVPFLELEIRTLKVFDDLFMSGL